MSSAVIRIKLNNVTLEELQGQVDKLCFAGWGKANLDFATDADDWRSAVEIKMFRDLGST